MSRSIPVPEVINGRLEAQRRRIFEAQGIIGAVSRAAHAVSTFSLTEEEQQGFANDAWMSLEHLHGMLEDIAGGLEPAVMLDTERSGA